MIVCIGRDVNIPLRILNSNANVNAQCSSNKTAALMMACEKICEEIVSLLLNPQADPNLHNH